MDYKINRRVAKKLSEEFDVTYAEIGKLYNASREAVSRLFRNGYEIIKDTAEIDEVSIEELEAIFDMIQKKLYYFNNGELELKLLNDMNKKFGFIIKRNNYCKVVFNEDFEKDKKWEKIIKIIKDNRLNEFSSDEFELIENSKEIIIMKEKYFRPNDYRKFHQLKNKRNMNEEIYVKFLGYENYASKKIENTDDKIIKFFEDNLIDGKVYIASDIPWLRKHIHRQKMSVEQFVKFFGYEQCINRNKKIKKENNGYSLKYVETMLNKLQVEQKNKDKIRKIKDNEKLIIERSKEMIKTLKELYGGKCQICQNKGIEAIIEKNGEIYSEAHHIKELSKAKTLLEEDDEILDHYQNVIVLCPHHHRYLHYNKGGDYKLKSENGMLYFENDHDKIRVELNYHLK